MQIFFKGGRMMLLTTQTQYLNNFFGIKDAIEMIARAGFDSLDYSMFHMLNNECVLNTDDYPSYVDKVKKIAADNSLTFTQAHAPFNLPYDTGEKEHIEIVTKKMIRSLEIASLLEIPIIVVHPLQYKAYYKHGNPKYFKKINREFYGSLMPYCEKLGVKIACENMWQYHIRKKKIVDSVCADPLEFNEYIDSVGSENLVACLDLGHCELTGRKAQDCIRAMGQRIQALHVHDNHGSDDGHMMPGYGRLEWDEILKALADIDYKGNFTYEADSFLAPYKDDPEGAQIALDLMAHVGRKMIAKFNEYSANK